MRQVSLYQIRRIRNTKQWMKWPVDFRAEFQLTQFYICMPLEHYLEAVRITLNDMNITEQMLMDYRSLYCTTVATKRKQWVRIVSPTGSRKIELEF